MSVEVYAVLSVCQCCYVAAGTGEPCERGDECSALNRLTRIGLPTDRGIDAVPGGPHSEHCQRATDGECDCDKLGFSDFECEGCDGEGSWLAGDRFALTLLSVPFAYVSAEY